MDSAYTAELTGWVLDMIAEMQQALMARHDGRRRPVLPAWLAGRRVREAWVDIGERAVTEQDPGRQGTAGTTA